MSKFPLDLDDQALRHLVAALMESGQAISIYDSEDRLRYANKAYRNIFLGEYEGPFTFSDILRYGAKNGLGVRIDGGDVEALIARTLSRRRSTPRKSFETDFMDGRWFWMDHTILPNGWVLTVGTDITTLKHNEKILRRAHEEALRDSRTDLLTGLPNRRQILERLDEALAARTGFCIAVIDIDRFKMINDGHGHEAGDTVLKQFAAVCQSRLRPQDYLGRMGGEEFLLLLLETRLNDAVRTFGRIRTEFPPATLNGGCDLPYTFSAGITEALPQDDCNSILGRADRALYTAKRDGRNRTKIGFDVEF